MMTSTLYEHRVSLLWEELYMVHEATKRCAREDRERRLAKRDALVTAYLIITGDDPDTGVSEDAVLERLDEIWLNKA